MNKDNVLVIIDEINYTEDNKKKIYNLYPDSDIKVVVFNSINGVFYLNEDGGKKEIRNGLEQFMVVADYIINFLNFNLQFRDIEKQIELVGVRYFGNNLMNLDLLSKKINIKKILEKLNFKTPIFEKIRDRSSNELFLDFPQPSRVFSKENNYFSDKISTPIELMKIFKEQEKKIKEYYIEEYIDGNDVYTLAYRDVEGRLKTFSVEKEKGGLKKITTELEDEILIKVTELFDILDIKKFALLNIKNKNNSLNFLNVFVQNINILEKNIISEILEINNLKINDIFERD